MAIEFKLSEKISPKWRTMSNTIEHAKLEDVDELLSLYLSVYGEDYPLEVGTKRSVMTEAICSPEKYHWYVMRCEESGLISASGIIQIDNSNRIAKLSGVAVHSNFRKHGLATELISYAVNEVLRVHKLANSIYATARTITHSSQTMLLRNGFIPLGFFPNCRKIKTYETLALMAIFADGVLEKRNPNIELPSSIHPFASLVEKEISGYPSFYKSKDVEVKKEKCFNDLSSKEGEFEFIFAPQFVQKRFDETFKDDKESVFYPFHRPNLIISNMEDDFEVFATFSKKDHYCVIITSNKSIVDFGKKLNKMLFAMKELGIYYVETMVRLDRFEPIHFLTENDFLPSAIYPAMHEEDGHVQDYVLLTKTMVPLDFSEISIHESFRPYFNLYAKQWIDMHLNTLKVNS
jgi:RimJ/RimL family protein N-acetyltransferase